MTSALSPSETCSPGTQPSVIVALSPLLLTVLVAFLVIGLALPVLPLHVHGDLGFGTFAVGLVTGSQFAASLVSRYWSGRTCDRQGAKRAVVIGLLGAAAAGLLYILSFYLVTRPALSIAVLLAGRAVLGAAESFIITGATVWGLGRVGNAHAGKVIAWMGTAMFAGFASSAPIGVELYSRGGFAAVAFMTAIAPLLTLALVAPIAGVSPNLQSQTGMLAILRRIWVPGVGAACSSVGFGVILSFASLLFSERGWTPIWLAFSAYAVALIAARLFFGHLPDRVGGAKVALACVLVEACGLLLIGLASSGAIAALGAALTGAGYALVFPGLGIEAVRRAPPEGRGLAMGAYTACLDLALGISGPALGLLANHEGLASVFLAAALVVLAASGFALQLLRSPTR